jgi:adenosylcobinamide-phosphate synthase
VVSRPLAAAAGLLADAALGEPPLHPHPVAAFGSVMRFGERHLYAPTRRAGLGHAAMGVGLGAAAGALLPVGIATYLAVAGRALHSAALDAAQALDRGDLVLARSLLPALVGRDPSDLDPKEVARAVVESVAENTVDAVVAPALWAAVAGGPGALGYRAVNTLDAMVGHHDDRYERYGWASARLDDAANWVPARITAALVGVVRPAHAAAVWSVVRRHAAAHPSPNSGVAEAAFAGALGLRLGGENRYGDRVELRPPLGDGRPAEPGDIAPAVRLSRHVGLALATTLAGVSLGAHRRERS